MKFAFGVITSFSLATLVLQPATARAYDDNELDWRVADEIAVQKEERFVRGTSRVLSVMGYAGVIAGGALVGGALATASVPLLVGGAVVAGGGFLLAYTGLVQFRSAEALRAQLMKMFREREDEEYEESFGSNVERNSPREPFGVDHRRSSGAAAGTSR